MKGYVVYMHIRQDTREVFYIGMGKTRGRAYEEYSRTPEWYNVVNQTFFDVVIVSSGLSKEQAFSMEESLIRTIGIKNLTNKTLGGVGALGYKHTSSAKEKISKATANREVKQEWIDKSVKSKMEVYSRNVIHRETGEIIRGLKFACDKYNIPYKAEHQRLKRNSKNRNFDYEQEDNTQETYD